jgi:predicted RNA-binding Zn-ribbon protein involved in translation (DUF1610 family)
MVLCFFAVLGLAGGLDALSCWWQFGYVFQRFGVGLRREQLYYFSREDRIIPSFGFYVDDAENVNIVIGNSGGLASRWDQVGVRPWLVSLSLTGAVGIGLTSLAAKTRGRRRWKLRVALAIFTLADGVLWLISENVRWVYLQDNVYVLLTGGCVEAAVAADSRHFDVLRQSRPGISLTMLSFANLARIPRLSLSGRIPNGRLPLWIPLLLGLSPLLAVLLPARRTDHDQCSECDYDLTGNLSGVCPECGTRIGRAATSTKSEPLRDSSVGGAASAATTSPTAALEKP